MTIFLNFLKKKCKVNTHYVEIKLFYLFIKLFIYINEYISHILIYIYKYIYKQWEIIYKKTAKEMYKDSWIHGVEDHSLWENKVLGQFS